MIAVFLLATSLAPVEIIRNAVELSEKTDHLRRNFSVVQENISRSGGKTSTKTYEMTYRDGKPFRKLIRKDGKPVESKAEQYNQNEERRLEMFRELPKALDYTFVPDERVEGHDCWVMMAKPKPGYKPVSMRTSFLTQMEAKVWITKQHNRMIRLDAKTIGPVSFGGFIAKLAPGTRIQLDQVRVEEDVWLPKHLRITYDGRVLFFNFKGEIEQLTLDYKRINPTI